MEELRVDMRERTPEEQSVYDRQAQLMYKLDHTMPRTEEYMSVLKELFGDRIGEGSYLAAPVNGAGATIMSGVTIGKFAIVGAASVVTHDVGDYEVVVGSPARVIKTLDKDKFM